MIAGGDAIAFCAGVGGAMLSGSRIRPPFLGAMPACSIQLARPGAALFWRHAVPPGLASLSLNFPKLLQAELYLDGATMDKGIAAL